MDYNDSYMQTPGDPLYQAAPKKKSNSVLSIIAMACGIAGLLLSCCYGSGSILSIAAIVLALIDKSKSGGMNTFSKVGLILGIVGVAIGVIWFFILVTVGFSGFMEGFNEGFNNSYYYY